MYSGGRHVKRQRVVGRNNAGADAHAAMHDETRLGYLERH
jgi:hypothetical protein